MLTRLLLTTSLLTTAASVAAQDLPSLEVLDRFVAEALPSYWATENFETIATSRSGDAANPGAIVRFEVDAMPDADLFAEAGREGPFVIVVQTEPAKTKRRLYGIHDLTYRAGQWSGDVTIENPIDGLGQPRDLFSSPSLVLGDEKTEARLEALRSTALAGVAARQEAELARMGAAHEQAMAELAVAQEGRLADLRKANAKAVGEADSVAAEALAAAEAEGTRSVARLREHYETQRAKLTEGNEPTLKQARAERETLLATEQEETQKALSEARDVGTKKLETLRAKHAKRRGAMIETQRQEMAELETKLATERASLERQVEAGEEVVRLQGQLSTLLEERALGAARQMDAFEAAREARVDFFARLPRNWSGQVRCISDDGKIVDDTSPIAINFQGFTSNGVNAGVQWKPDSFRHGEKTSLVFIDEALSFPLRMHLHMAGKGWVPRNLEVSISQDGRMNGKQKQQWTIDKRPVDGTCTFQLAAAS